MIVRVLFASPFYQVTQPFLLGVPIAPVLSNNVHAIGPILWRHYPDDWDDLDRLDRIELYPDDWDDRVKFEAIIWKHSQTTATIGTIEGYPRKHHSYSGNGGEIGPGLSAEAEKNTLRVPLNQCALRAFVFVFIRDNPSWCEAKMAFI